MKLHSPMLCWAHVTLWAMAQDVALRHAVEDFASLWRSMSSTVAVALCSSKVDFFSL